MPSAQEARDARRRKILARGSDRLAFIVGELPTVPPAPSPSPSPSPSPAGTSDSASLTGGATPPADAADPTPPDIARRGDDGADWIRGIGTEATDPAVVETVPEPKTVSLDGWADEKAFDWEQKAGGGGVAKPWAWTWDGVGRSIDATQNYRAAGACALALLLVAQDLLSCGGDGGVLGGWAPPWPVALVVATDVSLWVGFLMLGSRRWSLKSADAADIAPEEDERDETLARMFKTLGNVSRFVDVGTVLYKSSRALFLDCSIYVVALASGFSLTRQWQSPFCAAG